MHGKCCFPRSLEPSGGGRARKPLMQLHVSGRFGCCLSSVPDNGARLFLFAKVVRRRATAESDSPLELPIRTITWQRL